MPARRRRYRLWVRGGARIGWQVTAWSDRARRDRVAEQLRRQGLTVIAADQLELRTTA